jgi:hypothetical protein
MVLDDLNTSASFRLSRLLAILESKFGVTIDFAAAESAAELQAVYEAFGEQREQIIRESAFNTYNANPDYVKASLIRDAISLFLSEVAPKRIHRPRGKKNPS